MAQPIPRRPIIHELTALRFAAAFLVVVHHLSSVGLIDTGRHGLGAAGVAFFFVLSGFVLTYTYLDRLTGAAGSPRYLWARFARIWPLHAAAFTVSAWQIAHYLDVQLSQDIGLAVRNLALVQAWSDEPGVASSFNGVSWSISVEALFYVSLPLILLALGAARSVRSVLVVAAAGWATSVALLVWFQRGLSPEGLVYYFNFFPPIRLIEFLLGCVAAYAFVRGGMRVRGWATPRRATVLQVGAVTLFALAIAYAPHVPHGVQRLTWWTVPAVAVVAAFALGSSGVLQRTLRHPLPQVLGEASYSLYMWHFVVIVQFTRFTQVEWITAHPRWGALALAALSVIASIVSWLVIERPARHLLLALTRSRRPRAARVAAETQ